MSNSSLIVKTNGEKLAIVLDHTKCKVLADGQHEREKNTEMIFSKSIEQQLSTNKAKIGYYIKE